MARYSTVIVLVLTCLFKSEVSYGMQIPKWTDIFSALEPYKDPSTQEDAGEPRIGFVQLNSGTTTYNSTLNLTGHILLGLGISSALLLYMFFNAFDTVGNDYGYLAAAAKYRNKLPNTGFNATLNLTGHIILGLGVAASLLLYMFFSAFNRNDYHHYHSRYGAYLVEKRDLSDYNQVMNVLDTALQSYSTGSLDADQCSTKLICQVVLEAKPENKTSLRSFLWETFRGNNMENEDNDSFWQESCKQFSVPCPLTTFEVKEILQSSISEWL